MDTSGLGFGLYLVLIGVQAGIAWAVSRCDSLHPLTLRYGLLAVLTPVGLLALHLALERVSIWRALTMGWIAAFVAVSLRGHVDLAVYQSSDPGPSEYRLLADELVARNLRYVMADYWAAYMVSFLSDEQVTATATDHMRILEYDREVERHADRAILLSREPCEGGQPFRRWYFCPVQ